MKTPAATPIPVLLFLAVALSTSSVPAAARFIHSFHRQAHHLPRFHGALFSPSFESSQAQRNLLPLNARDRLHDMTRFQRRNRFMSPLERSLVARVGTEFRFNRLPSLETKSPHVEKSDPSLPEILQKQNPSNRRHPAWNELPPECLQIRPLKTYPQTKQKVHPHGHSRKLLKAPYTNPPPPPARTSEICYMALIGMGWKGIRRKSAEIGKNKDQATQVHDVSKTADAHVDSNLRTLNPVYIMVILWNLLLKCFQVEAVRCSVGVTAVDCEWWVSTFISL
ncbi:hypothetical protein ACLOJK_015933 [Asimina triloba]